MPSFKGIFKGIGTIKLERPITDKAEESHNKDFKIKGFKDEDFGDEGSMIRTFELFAGYGGASFALKKANIEFECVGFSEIDKNAIKIFELNHPNAKNYGDSTKINPKELPDFDFLFGGFPCQSFSQAGLNLGELDPRGTLFNDIIRIAEVKHPKYMLLENVEGLTFNPHKKTFDKIISELRRIGYDVIYKVCNSKDYGVPQNRNRIWFVCKYGQWEFMEFMWPTTQPLKIFVKDILEENVDKKYNLSEKQIKMITDSLRKRSEMLISSKVRLTLLARDYKDGGKYIQFDTSGKGYKSQQDRVYPIEGVMNSIPSNRTDNKVNIFALRGRNPDNPSDRKCGIDLEQTPEIQSEGIVNSLTSVQKDNLLMVHNLQQRSPDRPSLQYSAGGSGHLSKADGTTYCLDTHNSQAVSLAMNTLTGEQEKRGKAIGFLKASEILYQSSFMFRRLTPRECMRLMGFLNDEIQFGDLKDGPLYKLAGNGWDINIASKIIKNMLKNDNPLHN